MIAPLAYVHVVVHLSNTLPFLVFSPDPVPEGVLSDPVSPADTPVGAVGRLASVLCQTTADLTVTLLLLYAARIPNCGDGVEAVDAHEHVMLVLLIEVLPSTLSPESTTSISAPVIPQLSANVNDTVLALVSIEKLLIVGADNPPLAT
jgi:hypothetical protein